MMTRRTAPGLLAAGLAMLLASAGEGLAIPIWGDTSASTEGLADFSGTLTFVAADTHTATLTLSLTNTTDSAIGGYLTAFALRGGTGITGVSLTSAPTNFGQLGFVSGGILGSPFGGFDFGASTSPGAVQPWLGSGDPSLGLGVGASGTFVFGVTGSGLEGIAESDFIRDYNLVVRFRGLGRCGGGSDKVPAVPEPSSLLVLLLGLFGLGVQRRLGA